MGKRVTHMRKLYVYENGETGRSAKPGWVKLQFQMLAPEKDDNGDFVVVNTRELAKDSIEADIADCALGHGLSQKIGDDLAGIADKAKKDNVQFDAETGYSDYIVQRIDDMLAIFEAGVWITESEGSGSGNVTILFEAMVAAFADSGVELTPEQQTTIRENLKDEDYRKSAKEMPEVNAKMQAILAERAAERAKKAQAKAADSSSDLAALIGG